jgi:hypothetical protein
MYANTSSLKRRFDGFLPWAHEAIASANVSGLA